MEHEGSFRFVGERASIWDGFRIGDDFFIWDSKVPIVPPQETLQSIWKMLSNFKDSEYGTWQLMLCYLSDSKKAKLEKK